MENYLLGLDNGGTMVKAVIFDGNGKEVAGAAAKLRMITPEASMTERDMEELWEANCQVIREALAKAGGGAAEKIRGIACSGHGKGLYLWGKDNKPAYNGIVSTDGRAWKYPEQWQKDGTAEKAFEKTYQRILASQPVSILNWFKEHKPEVLENTQWIFECKDYIRFRLTGEAFAEKTDYSGSGLMNLRDRCFDEELLALFGLKDLMRCLPPLKNATDVCGAVCKETAERTGLREGTPVSGGMFDIDACAVAMDVTDEKNLCVIAGTWSINEFLSKTPVLDGTIMMNSIFALPEYYLVEECSATSAGNHEWFTEMFLQQEKEEAKRLGMNVYQYTDRLAAEVEPADQNIIFLPFLYGSNYDPRAKACFVGLDSHHTRAQIIRAVLEGVVFCHMVHIEKLLLHMKPSAIRLAGGAANSPLWVQMFADVTGLPVEIVKVKELGALGCAMTAAVAAGLYSDCKDAAKHMVTIGDRVEPNMENHKIYQKKYELYRKVSDALFPLWGDFSQE